LLGDSTDVNRASAEAAEVALARWLLNPRLDKLRDALNTQFLPMYGSLGTGYEFDYEDPTPMNEEALREQRAAIHRACGDGCFRAQTRRFSSPERGRPRCAAVRPPTIARCCHAARR
jgi:hypothetical protein